jgi:hypothetical protein
MKGKQVVKIHEDQWLKSTAFIYGKTGDGKIPTAMIRLYYELKYHDIYLSIYIW